MNGDALRLWRQRVWLWLPALIFFLLNLGLLSAYRLVYAGRVLALEERIEQRVADLADLERLRRERAVLLERAVSNSRELTAFYEQGLATESERLTAIIAEVKELAQRVGLRPSAITYPEERIEEIGLIKRSLAFAVVGTYGQLRQLINLMELSESFLVLEEVELAESGGAGGPRLRITLRISTYFSEADLDPGTRPGGEGRS